MRERRKYVRFPLVANVKYSHLNKPEEEKECLSIDLSAVGIKLCLKKALPIGERLKVSFTLPVDSTPILVEGRVSWTIERGSDKTEVGIEFMKISDEDREKIINYVKRCLTWD